MSKKTSKKPVTIEETVIPGKKHFEYVTISDVDSNSPEFDKIIKKTATEVNKISGKHYNSKDDWFILGCCAMSLGTTLRVLVRE